MALFYLLNSAKIPQWRIHCSACKHNIQHGLTKTQYQLDDSETHSYTPPWPEGKVQWAPNKTDGLSRGRAINLADASLCRK